MTLGHRTLSSALLPVLAGAALIALSCGDDGNGGAPDAALDIDAPLSPECAEAVDHADLAWLQENIFTPSCGNFSVCHQGTANAALGLNLEDGNTEANLVGQPSSAYPDETLVIPGDPANSYLLVVLGSYDGPQLGAGTMPPNNPLLCVEKRQAIERWIQNLPPP